MKSTSQPMAEATEFHINRPVIESSQKRRDSSVSKANDVDSYSRYCLKERARHLNGHDDHYSRHDRHNYHHNSSPK
ncbi:hypothetical protein HanXRQr2_Chr02g0074161 [Helianthus annuus]|uniref:Uncharacterized protein n=1 Tax=Helianthus annuus TaxID=4232 RepID=A0A9K3JPW6_HELAN|nr:hypothetical protein HanXRQr2_Chr02g0074161 [Helianthus annuus]KAJ0605337.1 hypothetical protein HanHA300_Chr02g0061891 [Helianthus annuus]KAJ0619352.1 hypothetical protein HanHA89_Chr02g0070391 [Helianthus annuus]